MLENIPHAPAVSVFPADDGRGLAVEASLKEKLIPVKILGLTLRLGAFARKKGFRFSLHEIQHQLAQSRKARKGTNRRDGKDLTPKKTFAFLCDAACPRMLLSGTPLREKKA